MLVKPDSLSIWYREEVFFAGHEKLIDCLELRLNNRLTGMLIIQTVKQYEAGSQLHPYCPYGIKYV